MISSKPFIYNPAQKAKQQLIAEFVVRKKIFEELFNDIKGSDRRIPPQNYLVVGQRGMGKTTMLLRIKFAIEDDLELNQYLIPIRFSEEQYNITRLEHLWEETAQLLGAKNANYTSIFQEMEKYEDKENYERIIFELLAKELQTNGHRILLLIDNIGELFEKFPHVQNNRLREVLTTSPYIQIIGTSSKVLEHTFQYDKPFYEFFNQKRLEPLDTPNTIELLKALGREYKESGIIEEIIDKQPQRIETLRRITGGVPRTIVLLFEIFIDNRNGDAFEDLQHLLDEVNSLYKHRMDELKPQQQQILDTLAKAWDPISASEVLERSKLYRENVKSNQISAQLSQMADNQLVEIVEGKTRKKTYRIRERFFNIWYLMRHGRKQNREEVLWLIKFMEAWCTVKDLVRITKEQIGGMNAGHYSERAAYYKALAINSISGVDYEIKGEVLRETEKFLLERGNEEWAKRIGQCKNELERSQLNKVNGFIENKQYNEAETLLLELIEKSPETIYIHIMAELYEEYIRDYDKAEHYYLMAVEHGSVDSMHNLGLFYKNTRKDYDSAEHYYLMAVDKGDVYSMYNLGLFYKNIRKDYDSAEHYYLMAADKGDVNSMHNLGLFYYNIRRDYDKAEHYYLMAINKGDVDSMRNLGMFYHNIRKDYDKAEHYYLMAANKGDVDSMCNLGMLYDEIREDDDKAEHYYLMAIENGDINIMNNLGALYENIRKDHNKAMYYFLRAAEHDSVMGMYNLVVLYIKNRELVAALSETERLLSKNEIYEYPERLIFILEILLINKQFQFVLKKFKEENSRLMQYALPVYYVLAYFMKDELPGVYEQAGSEIKETVDEIIQSIEDKQQEEDKEVSNGI